MEFIGRIFFWMASPAFSLIVFSIASALYWSFLALLLTGVLSARHYGDWLAAIGGTLFFPFLGVIAWRHRVREQARAVEEEGNREYSMDLKNKYLQSYLVRRITVAEAEDMFRGEVAVLDHLFPLDKDCLPYFREFIEQDLTADDELWIYDSGAESWENLAGCWGFAAVREGKVVSFHEVAMN